MRIMLETEKVDLTQYAGRVVQLHGANALCLFSKSDHVNTAERLLGVLTSLSRI